MTPYSHRIPGLAGCGLAAMCALTPAASAQVDFGTPSQGKALAIAAKASPELVNGLAKELGSTPEQAAGAAGVLFGIAKSLLPPEQFAEVTKAVPGMDALLAAMPAGVVRDSGGLSALPGATPGFAASPTVAPGMTRATPDGMASAVTGFSKLGIKPEMIAKALPFLAGYLKKYGGGSIGSLLGGLFKTGK